MFKNNPYEEKKITKNCFLCFFVVVEHETKSRSPPLPPLHPDPDLGPVGGAEAEAPHVAEDEEAAPSP
jgi:hypothetical protein